MTRKKFASIMLCVWIGGLVVAAVSELIWVEDELVPVLALAIFVFVAVGIQTRRLKLSFHDSIMMHCFNIPSALKWVFYSDFGALSVLSGVFIVVFMIYSFYFLSWKVLHTSDDHWTI